MNFFQKFRDFVSQPTHSRTMGLLGIFVFVGIISLTVIVAQQQQQTRRDRAREHGARLRRQGAHAPQRAVELHRAGRDVLRGRGRARRRHPGHGHA